LIPRITLRFFPGLAHAQTSAGYATFILGQERETNQIVDCLVVGHSGHFLEGCKPILGIGPDLDLGKAIFVHPIFLVQPNVKFIYQSTLYTW